MDQAKSIAIWVNKGGTFKTTFTDVVPAILQKEKGLPCLVIDADPQANLTTDNGIDNTSVLTLYEVIKGKASPEEVIIKGELFDILPAPDKIALEEDGLFGNKPGREYIFRQLFQSLKDRYKYIFFDVGTGFGMLTMNVLTFADEVIFPIQPSKNSIKGMEQSMENIASIRAILNPDLQVRGILLGKVPNRRVIGIEQQINRAVEFAQAFQLPIFETYIRHSFKIEETEDKETKEDINLYKAMPNEEFMNDFRDFVNEFLRRESDGSQQEN